MTVSTAITCQPYRVRDLVITDFAVAGSGTIVCISLIIYLYIYVYLGICRKGGAVMFGTCDTAGSWGDQRGQRDLEGRVSI